MRDADGGATGAAGRLPAVSDPGAHRSIETPEGVGVRVELADLGTRAAALLLDLAIIVCAALVGLLMFQWLFAPLFGTQASMALAMLLMFFLRCPYFLFFELRWQGQTPGKRALGLRVVDRRGGALSPTALAARNIMREVEVFLPMGLLLTEPPNMSGGTFWFYAAIIWAGVFTLMPMFNRDRLRVGDMVGGTWVVHARRLALEHDLAAVSQRRWADARYHFTPAQLDAYGIAELQVLEQLLRGPRTSTTRETKDDVCKRIRARIGWTEAVRDDDVGIFLADYYAALRAHLERHALFGDRRTDKHAVGRSIAAGKQDDATTTKTAKPTAWNG